MSTHFQFSQCCYLSNLFVKNVIHVCTRYDTTRITKCKYVQKTKLDKSSCLIVWIHRWRKYDCINSRTGKVAMLYKILKQKILRESDKGGLKAIKLFFLQIPELNWQTDRQTYQQVYLFLLCLYIIDKKIRKRPQKMRIQSKFQWLRLQAFELKHKFYWDIEVLPFNIPVTKGNWNYMVNPLLYMYTL